MIHRREVWAKDVNLGVDGMYMEFKLARLTEMAKGGTVMDKKKNN